MKKLILFLVVILLFGCETEEQKKEKAQEVVKSFVSNLQFDNYETLYEYYPTFRDVETYWKFNSLNITSTILNSDGKVIIIGETDTSKQVFFELVKFDGNYRITKSKGLSSYYDSNLYKYCKKIGCIGMNEFDSDINRICKENKYDFEALVNSIKYKIENKTRIESNTLKGNFGYGYDYVSGEITIKNYSRHSIIGSSYRLYVNYLDSNDNVLFTSDESSSNYKDIGFDQSITLNIYQSIPSRFRKVNIELKLINTKFIESSIPKYAEGSNCIYSGNL